MQLGILQCDSVTHELQAEFGDYPDMFRNLLTAVDRSLSFQVYNLPEEHFPDDLGVCDGWLFTGSKWSVYDDAPWIRRAEELTMRLHHERRPTIGICFGHQLIARVLGGRVEKSSRGWGVGIHTARLAGQPPAWMQPAADELSLLVSHQDQVVELPPDAEWLAGHDFCGNDMFQVGTHMLTFQGHPEFPRAYARAMMMRRREKLGEQTYHEGIASLADSSHELTAARWILAFLDEARSAHARD
ncbi:MAG: hypothetical protein WED00_11320 [Aquisalimonadaceae bacterium]